MEEMNRPPFLRETKKGEGTLATKRSVCLKRFRPNKVGVQKKNKKSGEAGSEFL
jgi:hypothetical protein